SQSSSTRSEQVADVFSGMPGEQPQGGTRAQAGSAQSSIPLQSLSRPSAQPAGASGPVGTHIMQNGLVPQSATSLQSTRPSASSSRPLLQTSAAPTLTCSWNAPLEPPQPSTQT